MQSYDGYITIDSSISSKSGLYVTDLPGITVHQLHSLTKDEQDDFYGFFNTIYKNAQISLKIDVQRKLKSSFHFDQKLVSRETSEYIADINAASSLAGVKIKYVLPKYAKLQILTIEVKSEFEYSSPEAEFFIYKEDADGDLLQTISSELSAGNNVITVDQDFYEDELFICYDPTDINLRKTENKYFRGANSWDKLNCTFPCWGQEGSIQQINGGGINITFVVMCDIKKFILENLPIFADALWYRIGVELIKERKVSDRVNRFTVITEERATELMSLYNEEYIAALETATDIININEDPVCFSCKSSVTKMTSLP